MSLVLGASAASQNGGRLSWDCRLPFDIRFILVGFVAADPKARDALTALALASPAHFHRLVRPFILRYLVVQHHYQLRDIVDWLESHEAERRHVRRLRILPVEPYEGAFNSSQGLLALLLRLLPRLEGLVFSDWPGSRLPLADSLAHSLGTLTSLRDLSVLARGNVRGRVAFASAVIAALPAGHQLQHLRLEFPFHVPSNDGSLSFRPDLKARCITLYGLPMVGISTLGIEGLSGTVVPTPTIDNISRQLKILTVNSNTRRDAFELEMPVLTTVQLAVGAWIKYSDLARPALPPPPLLRQVKTLVWMRWDFSRDVLEAVLGKFGELETLYMAGPRPGGQTMSDSELLEALGDILASGTKVVLDEAFQNPDLLALQDDGARINLMVPDEGFYL